MNVSDIAGMLDELDTEVVDGEIVGADAGMLAGLRAERAALVTEGVALEEREAEEGAVLDRAQERAFSMPRATPAVGWREEAGPALGDLEPRVSLIPRTSYHSHDHGHGWGS